MSNSWKPTVKGWLIALLSSVGSLAVAFATELLVLETWPWWVHALIGVTCFGAAYGVHVSPDHWWSRSAGRQSLSPDKPPKKQPPISWSRAEWGGILTQSGLTEAVYRRENPSKRWMQLYEDIHVQRIIENKLLEDFRDAHAGVIFESKRKLLSALRSWAHKRAYEEWEATE